MLSACISSYGGTESSVRAALASLKKIKYICISVQQWVH